MSRPLLTIIFLLFICSCKTVHYVTYNISPNSPSLDDKIFSQNIRGEVKIVFDRFFIPHIEATDDHDAFYALGYVHAMERLFQMEIMKRFAYGRIAETFGNIRLGSDSIFVDAVTQDVWMRTIGLWRAAEVSIKDADPESLRIAEAYCAGINDYIKSGDTQIEFKLLDIKPEVFKPVHLIAIGRITAWSLSVNHIQELIRFLLKTELGDDQQKELFPPMNYKGVPIVDKWMTERERAKEEDYGYGDYRPEEYYRTALDILDGLVRLDTVSSMILPKAASNNWVVSGTRTESGFPILANDPHLRHSAPSIFYAVHIKTQTLDVMGVSIPGTPVIILGHNRNIVWGATNTFADVQDIYFERLDPSDPEKYITPHGSRDFYVEEHTIFERTTNNKYLPHTFSIRHTIHGPVLNDALGAVGRQNPPIALKTTMYHSASDFKAVYGFMKARNVFEFRDALRYWDIPIQNWVVADREGNIGYFPFGRIPKRIGWDGSVPVEGWSGRYEWDGYIPYEEIPQIVNPESGIIITANNKVVEPARYKYPFTLDAMPGYRAERIGDLINNLKNVNVKSLQKIQMDVYSKQAEYIMPVIKDALSKGRFRGLEEEALKILMEWNMFADADSVGASLFFIIHRNIFEMTLRDDLSAVLYNLILNSPYSHGFFDVFIVEKGDSKLWDIKVTEKVEKRDDIIAMSFIKTVSQLRERFGDNVSEWRWGNLHRILFAHPLGADSRVRKTFNVGGIPTSGARETVKAASYKFENSLSFTDVDGAAFRQVCDTSDLAECDIIIDLGQSGWAVTAGYTNALSTYLRGEYWDTSMDPQKYSKDSKGIIRLLPRSRCKK